MRLYYHPISTTSRPILWFAREHALEFDLQVVDLFTGEHLSEAYAAINPNRLVPVLEDGDFRLTESSTILKYLADKIDSPAYPRELRARARVNEMMDWINSNFYRDFAYGLVYPQVFPHHRRPSEEQHTGTIQWGRTNARRWLDILDRHLLGAGRPYLCGDAMTLADYFGAPVLTAGEMVGCSFTEYPNVERWLDRMKARPSWAEVNAPFAALIGTLAGQSYVAIQETVPPMAAI